MSAPDGYELVWRDEFESSGLPHPERWRFDTAGNKDRWGNNEAQRYTAGRPENAWVEDGSLRITAHANRFPWRRYTSARLYSINPAGWRYGRIEARIAFPRGRGVWSALWMLPTDSVYGAWPRSGEIDIAECVGFESTALRSSLHTKNQNALLHNPVTHSIDVAPDSSVHCVLDWSEDLIQTELDGVPVLTYHRAGGGPDYWPFDRPFYLILNVAVGGSLGGRRGVDPRVFPCTLTVDYVRVHQAP